MSEETSDLIRQRVEKVSDMREKGINPYPIRYKRTHFSANIMADFDDENPVDVSIAGRIKSKRVMGKASFAHLEDRLGTIQMYARRDTLGEEKYSLFKTFDLGDIIGVSGKTFRTKQGEITVEVHDVVMLAKCIRPLPVVKEKDGQVFDEFADQELRYRQRY
ncbi:MAG TPA: OB-fold nucleic acid binding domain-containing protein, partial [Spirochaetota bacterium]|nr:OB-fold nucleic acid binding domain-containing protein [Spirochaetota bacterium]